MIKVRLGCHQFAYERAVAAEPIDARPHTRPLINLPSRAACQAAVVRQHPALNSVPCMYTQTLAICGARSAPL